MSLDKENSLNDLMFCVLACSKNEKYASRLKCFIDSYGFKINRSDIGVKFAFLVDDEPRPDFIPNNYIWHNCPGVPLSCRLLNFMMNFDIDSRWLMQVDDDSSTDIDKTCELLEQFYDHDDPMILMGGRNTDLELRLQNIARKMKIENLFFGHNDLSTFDTTPYFIHAWEPSIISISGIKKIKKWERLQEFYDLCMTYRPGFSDQTPYFVAKMSKVPIVECLFISPFNKSTDFSATKKEGRYSHIHYITDKWPGFQDFKIRMKAQKEDLKNEDVQNNLWELWGGEDGRNYYGMLSINSDNTVGIYKNDNEFFWSIEGETLTFLNKNKEPTSVLKKITEKEFEGHFIPNKKITHRLIKID